MSSNLNRTMGRVIAEAWSDTAFKARLLEDPKPALAALGIVLPDTVTIIARENTEHTLHLAISAPPMAMPISALSEIRDFGEIYRDPRLWSLNWIGRDPVAAGSLMADPVSALRKIGVRVPNGLEIIVRANTATHMHLILPPRPPDRRCTPHLLKHLSAGHASASLRLGPLFGTGPYDAVLEGMSSGDTPAPGEVDA